MNTSNQKRSFYDPLPEGVAGQLVPLKGTKHDTEHSFVSAFLERVLQENRKEDKDVLFKYVSIDEKTTKKKKHIKKRAKSLTARQKKELNLFKLQPDDAKYALYLPLHELWKDYTRDLLCLDKVTSKNQAEAERRFMKSDLHGSFIVVAKSKCPSLVGLSGIVLQETKHTFKIVTKSSQLKTIPKRGTVFSISLDDYVFTIYGSNFMFRASDRASRSFKVKLVTDLA